MNYCSKCDVAYEERNCPVCDADDLIKGLRMDVDSRDTKVEELETENSKLESKVEELEEELREKGTLTRA